MTDIKQPVRHRPADDTYRIMVMDEPENVASLTKACQLAGHEVVPVLSIAEGMKFLDSKDHVDVVISAVHLENESVFDFLKLVRAEPQHKNVRFMMICTNPSDFAMAVDPTVRTAAQVMGVDKYLMMDTYDVTRLMKELSAILPDALPMKEQDPETAQ